MHRRILALALAGVVTAAAAENMGTPPGTPQQPQLPDTPEWKEVDVPPPPALRTTGLVPVEVPGTSLRFGIDPASITIGRDSIVRYVVVATSGSGAVNAMYEGIRCETGEVRVYARYNPGSGWVPSPDAPWVSLQSQPNRRYSLAIARDGACYGTAPNGSPQQIVRDLRAPVGRRFERGGVNQ